MPINLAGKAGELSRALNHIIPEVRHRFMPSGSAIKMLNPTKLTIAEIESQPLLCYTELLALHIDHILWVEWLNITLFALYMLLHCRGKQGRFHGVENYIRLGFLI